MKITGFIYALAAAVTWGLVYTIDGKILERLSPLALLFVSAAVTLVITFPIVIFDTASVRTVFSVGKANLTLIVVSIVLAVLANFFIYSAIKLLDASTASIFEIAYPFFVVLFTALLYRSVPNLYFLLGAVLIFFGSFVIIKFA